LVIALNQDFSGVSDLISVPVFRYLSYQALPVSSPFAELAGRAQKKPT
jgi:hypothetical protein